jgi:hypothetical protein
MNGRISPYQGLAPFEERDAAYFFGRESEKRLIVADLHAAPLTLLYGASGVGKSSVLRAGVLPLLRQQREVLVVVFAGWKDAPLAGFRTAVEQALLTGQTAKRSATYRRVLERHKHAALRDFLVAVARTARRRLMIILDQFEESSLYHPDDDDFAREFPAAASVQDLSVTILLSLREEAVARLDRFEGRIPELFDNYRRITHLSDEAARDAITRPLDQYSKEHPDMGQLTIEPELVTAVIEQVRSGQIADGTGGIGTATPAQSRTQPVESPYLQLVMSKLWNYERDRDSSVLHLSTLNHLGSATAIVEGHLEGVMAALGEQNRDIAARVFERLVTPSGTKIAYSVHDLSVLAGIDAERLSNVLESLARGADRILRLIPPPPSGGATRYEIFHDRLAPAVLKWCNRYLKEQEVTREREKELTRRRAEVGSAVEAAQAGPSTGPQPPYSLLASLLQEQQVVVVMGAAVSASSRPAQSGPWQPGSPFPPMGWELEQQLAAEADFPRGALPKSTLAEVVSYFEREFGRRTLEKRIREIFKANYPPSKMQRLLAQVSLRVPQLILTTTVDRLMEDALHQAGVEFEALATTRDLDSKPLLWFPAGGGVHAIQPKEYEIKENVTSVYKMFGSISPAQPQLESFLISEEDEIDLAAEMSRGGRLPPTAIRRELAQRHILFLGMGLGSWTQRLFLRTMLRIGSRPDEDRRSGWAIVRGPSELDKRRWHQARIEVFDTDINEFADKLGAALHVAG